MNRRIAAFGCRCGRLFRNNARQSRGDADGLRNLKSAHLGTTITSHICKIVKSMRSGRFSPSYLAVRGGAAAAHVQLHNPEAALKYNEESITIAPKYATLHSAKVAACAMLDRTEVARATVEVYNSLVGTRATPEWCAYNDYTGSEGGQRYFGALLQAVMTP